MHGRYRDRHVVDLLVEYGFRVAWFDVWTFSTLTLLLQEADLLLQSLDIGLVALGQDRQRSALKVVLILSLDHYVVVPSLSLDIVDVLLVKHL